MSATTLQGVGRWKEPFEKASNYEGFGWCMLFRITWVAILRTFFLLSKGNANCKMEFKDRMEITEVIDIY